MYGSSSFRTFNKVLIIIDKIIRIIIKQKIKPSSSPATAKIKSVLASGIFSFKIPCPGPLPSNPPLLKAFILKSIWYVSSYPVHQEMNLFLSVHDQKIKYEKTEIATIKSNATNTKKVDKPATNN